MDARATYEAGRVMAQAAVDAHEGRIRALGFARIAAALAGLGLIVGIVWAHLPSSAWLALFAVVVTFIGLVIAHARVFAAKDRALGAVRFHERGTARLGSTWRAFPTNGAAYAKAEHPFADDLDVFGPSSLFQLLDATETPFGRDRLAAWLGSPEGAVSFDTWRKTLLERQAAVRELGPDVAWREQLSMEAWVLRGAAPDPTPFLAWAEGKSPLVVPVVVVWLARVLPFVVLATYLLAERLGLPRASWVAVVGLEILISMQFREGVLATMDAVSQHAGGFARYGSLFAVAAAKPRVAARLAALVTPLRDGGDRTGGVVTEMNRLERIVGFVEARRNEVFKLFLGPVLMWDLNFAVLLEAWRRRSGQRLRAWFEALGELEAFASLAGFAFDRPGHAWPEPSNHVELRATQLGHPLIDGTKRVSNDVTLPRAGTALVVTGSNMSGKSTLLRALGVNTVLAQAGGPVAATSFVFGHVTLATSMRVRDSLDDGVSHFYAELQKLKRVVDLAKGTPPLLFLLDEILHGTNSRERIIGARAVLEGLVARGAIGAASTHDLGIADLAEALPDDVFNVHFEEQVKDDGTMTFDYRLRQGTVQSSNALRLMRAIGLEVPLEPSAPPLPGSVGA